jgi:hypothetical protein
LEVGSGGFATALIRLHIERKLLALVEIVHAAGFGLNGLLQEHAKSGYENPYEWFVWANDAFARFLDLPSV